MNGVLIATNGALLWWRLLCLAALVNIAAWGFAAWGFAPDPDVETARRALLWLSAIYVAGCAFRSILPMIDVPRFSLHDTPVSRIFVGRSVATVAELAFVLQWALLMHEAGAVRAAYAVVAVIVVAEVLSWLAVLTRNDFFHAAENALWTVAAALAAAFLASRWSYQGPIGRNVILAALICAAAYIVFMAGYVVPMYARRWRAEGGYLRVDEGMRPAMSCRCTHVAGARRAAISGWTKGCAKCSRATRSSATGASGARTRPGSRPTSRSACG
jgi:hypothetical protein